MAQSTTFTIKADIKDFESQIKVAQNRATEAFNAMKTSGKLADSAINMLNVAMKEQAKQLAPLIERQKELKTIKAQVRDLTKVEASELSRLNRQISAQTQVNNQSNKVLRSKIRILQQINARHLSDISTSQRTVQAIRKESSARSKNTQTLRKENAERRALGTSIARHIRRLESMAVAYYAITRAYNNTFGAGVQLNRQYENMEVGLAALLASKTKLIDITGKEGDSLTKFNVAQQQTKATLDEIKKAALDTPATFMEMAGFYQQAIGHALAAGDAFGGSLNEISSNTITLTKRMSSLGASVGMSMDLINEEIRSLMSGDVSRDSKLALILFGSPTAANAAIKEAKKSTDGLTQLFENVLSPFKELENVMTFDKQVNHLIYQIEEIQRVAAKPVFDDLQESFRKLTEYLKTDGVNISTAFIQMYQNVKTALPYVGELVKLYAAFKVGGAISSGFVLMVDMAKKMKTLKKEMLAISKIEMVIESSLHAMKTKGLSIAVGAAGAAAAYALINHAMDGVGKSAKDAAEEVDILNTAVKDGVLSKGEYKPFDIIGDVILDADKKAALAEAQSMLKANQDALVAAMRDGDEKGIQFAAEGIKIYRKQIASLQSDIKGQVKLEQVKTEKVVEASKEELKWKKQLLKLQGEMNAKSLSGAAAEAVNIFTKYQAYTKEYAKVKGAQLEIDKWYNARLIQINEKAEKENLQTKQDSLEQSKRQLDYEFGMREKQINLLEDQTDKSIALAELNYEKARTELEYEQELYKMTEGRMGLTEQQAKEALDYAKQVKDKVVESYSAMSIAANAFKSSAESGLANFFDYASSGFMDFGKLVQNILHEIYMELLKTLVIKQMVSGISGGFGFSDGGQVQTFADGGRVQKFADGGLLTGGSGTKDDLYLGAASGSHVFAMGGEYILNKNATNSIGVSNLEAMNSTGKMPSSAVPVVINIENNTGGEIKQETQTTFDGEKMIVGVVLSAIQRNKMGMRDIIKNV